MKGLEVLTLQSPGPQPRFTHFSQGHNEWKTIPCPASTIHNTTTKLTTTPSAHPHLIREFSNYSITNVFCFGAFVDKLSGVVYNDCTRDFPYMSLDGNICFFVMYHYKTNANLITPIAGLDSERILEAYTSNFEYLVSKGLKPKINMMENQATKAIKAYLTPQQVTLQLVEPLKLWVNAVE